MTQAGQLKTCVSAQLSSSINEDALFSRMIVLRFAVLKLQTSPNVPWVSSRFCEPCHSAFLQQNRPSRAGGCQAMSRPELQSLLNLISDAQPSSGVVSLSRNLDALKIKAPENTMLSQQQISRSLCRWVHKIGASHFEMWTRLQQAYHRMSQPVSSLIFVGLQLVQQVQMSRVARLGCTV